MSYGSINISTVGKGVRQNNRTQLNRIRCSGIKESLEHWYTKVEGNRYFSSLKTFEPTARRWSQSESMGKEIKE